MGGVRLRAKVLGLGLGSALAAFLGLGATAQAENCLRVVSFEWKTPHIIDPANILENSDLMHVIAAYEPLAVFDNDFVVHPWLAESWKVSEDGKEWTFKLHEGVKFHDGAELTSEDVVYSFRRLIDPATGSQAKSDLSFMKPEDIIAKSKYEVVFKTAQPVAELPLLIAGKQQLIVRNGKTHDDLMKQSDGTGPFIIGPDFKSDSPRTKMMRNPNYWQAGKPYMSCIEVSGVPDPITRMATIQSGNADILIAADATTLPTLQKDPNVTLYEAKNAMMMNFAMQVDVPPFDDVRVRQALKLVIDRAAVSQLVTLGFGSPGNDNPVPLSSPFALQSTPEAQDIEKAKALLAEAGKSDLTVDLYTGASDLAPGMLALVQAYKGMAAEAGITVNVITTPNGAFWDTIYMKKPFFTAYWWTRHPASALSIGYRSDAQYNETHWKRPEFDQLLDKANAEIDPAVRTQLYKDAQRQLMEEGGVIIPTFVSVVAAVRKNCTGFVPHIESRILFQNIKCE
jgi:peptide/nickel transport system substrate-binding protein